MDPDAYGYVFVASISGGMTGALVMWNRRRSQVAGESPLRRLVVLILGTAASACALFAFAKAFGQLPQLYAALLVVLITGWVAVVQSVVRLPVPQIALRVRPGEFAVLRASWIGVRLFGMCLRKTPLRHLGGQVFLSEVGGDPMAVLRGIQAAEAVHLWAGLLTVPWFLVWGIRREWMLLVCGLAVHAPLNLYPILHLRYVTYRMERWLARAQCPPSLDRHPENRPLPKTA